jgi:catechol 2,3-dioxygenase-like lactoylglutathione lyase family enzyme
VEPLADDEAAPARSLRRRRRMMAGMEILASRILLRPTRLHRSHRFYRDTLGLAIYREFGSDDAPGIVFFMGNGLLEISGRATDPPGDAIALWMQVRDVRAEHRRLVDAEVTILREPRLEVWGLDEMWIADPDGVRIVLVEIPEEHPLRRDLRHLAADEE